MSENQISDESTPLLPTNSAATGITNWEASYHIVCVIAGTGLLQIPYAFGQAGWAGILFLIGAAWVNIYTGNLIIKCLHVNQKRLEGYPHIGEEAFGNVGYYLVATFYNMAMGGTVVLYLILAAMNLEQLLGYFSSRSWIVAISIGLLIPFLAVKTLKEVGFISFLGALASVVVVIIVAVVGSLDYPNYVDKVHHIWADPRAFGSVLGTLCFSYGGNYVYPEIYRTMAKKEDFGKVLKYSTVGITLMYLVVGVVGYLVYGNLAISPILFNLPDGFAKTFGISIITFHVIFACPLLLTTISKDLERHFEIETFSMIGLLRLGIVGLIATLALVLPFFSDMMSLIGAVSNTMLIFVLPIICDFKLFERNQVLLGWVIITVGLVGGGIGTFDALKALYNDIMRP
jgi:vesicular inhibitory amino acid transporter